MKMTQLTLAVLLATGFATAPFAAEAKKMKHKSESHSSTMAPQSTTGANMKDGGGSSSNGNVGPGTNQAGSMSAPAK